MVSAVVEMIAGAALLVEGGIHFLVTRAHQLKPLEQATEGTQLYFSGILILEYLLRPFSIILFYCAGEGFIRWLAAWSTEVTRAGTRLVEVRCGRSASARLLHTRAARP